MVGWTGGYTVSFATKDAGDGKTVTWSRIATLTGIDVGNYTVAYLHRRRRTSPLDITGAFTAENKVYDGNTDATVATRSWSARLTGDVVTLDGGAAPFDTSGVAPARPSRSGATLGGTDTDNYNLTSVADTTADITAKELTVSVAVADDKVYDGTTDATVAHRRSAWPASCSATM